MRLMLGWSPWLDVSARASMDLERILRTRCRWHVLGDRAGIQIITILLIAFLFAEAHIGGGGVSLLRRHARLVALHCGR